MASSGVNARHSPRSIARPAKAPIPNIRDAAPAAHSLACGLPRKNRRATGYSPVALEISRSHGPEPARGIRPRYEGADAPGRPGSARKIVAEKTVPPVLV